MDQNRRCGGRDYQISCILFGISNPLTTCTTSHPFVFQPPTAAWLQKGCKASCCDLGDPRNVKPTCPLAGWPPPKTSETRGPTTTDVSSARKTCFWVESEAKNISERTGCNEYLLKAKRGGQAFSKTCKRHVRTASKKGTQRSKSSWILLSNFESPKSCNQAPQKTECFLPFMSLIHILSELRLMGQTHGIHIHVFFSETGLFYTQIDVVITLAYLLQFPQQPWPLRNQNC